MTEEIRLKLLEWAREYHCAAFIQGDPVQLYKVTLFSSRIGICGSRILRLAVCSLL